MGNMVFEVAVAQAPVDETCRKVMHKLVSMGCVMADTRYSVEPIQVAEAELRYLLDHGTVHQPDSSLVVPVLRTVAVERKGADVGKISFELAVNLA
jgi:hypothetical protein